MTDMSLSDTLNAAADLIQTRGWTTIEDSFGDADTDPWGGGSGADAPVCLEGAIAAASGMDLTLGNATGTTSWDVQHCPAYKVVYDYLKGTDWWDGTLFTSRLYDFNDAPGRTKEEVIEVLRAAAVIEAAKEKAEVEV